MATAKLYGKLILSLFNKKIDWDSDTIKCALFTDTYTPNQDTDQYYDTLIGEVLSGNGYNTGGATLANKTITYIAGTNAVTIDADAVVWSASTITARYAVIYDDTPASSKPLICYLDFGVNKTNDAGNYSLDWDVDGISSFTVD